MKVEGRRVPGGKTFGSRLRSVRKALGLTLLEVAQAAGVSESVVSHYEHDRRDPSRETLWEVCKFLGDRGRVDPVAVANFLKGNLRNLRIAPIVDATSGRESLT